MYRFFIKPEQILEESAYITGSDVNHIKNVLRMKPGEQILVSDGESRDYLCEITELTDTQIKARIVDIEGENRELGTRLYLFQGLPKGDKMELIIQKAVELGVYQVIPVETKRSVVKLDAKKAKNKVARWNAIAESAAKQSKRQIIPKVGDVCTFKEALAYAKGLDMAVIPYEEAKDMQYTKQVLAKVKAGMDVGIFIGPEGGFSEGEIEAATAQDVVPITLGKRILRTETAGLMILSVLMYQLECED
jgi:16S rRNA (uracil1498-N3)-methyltransferase